MKERKPKEVKTENSNNVLSTWIKKKHGKISEKRDIKVAGEKKEKKITV